MDKNEIYKAFFEAIDEYAYEWMVDADEKEGAKIANYISGMFDLTKFLLEKPTKPEEASLNDND